MSCLLWLSFFVRASSALESVLDNSGDLAPLSPKIFTIGEPILSQTSRLLSVDEIISSEEVAVATRTAHIALEDFRRKNGFGRAIAAPQVGYAMSFVAMNLGQPETMFNPEIIHRSNDMFTMWDDCLSFPDLVVRVQRHESISVRFVNSKGETEVWKNCTRAVSELLQHEIDHLHGILAVDRRYDIDPDGNTDGIPGVVPRVDWEANRAMYAAVVDYDIS